MELPTPRELELEALLRRRDEQLAKLTDEITHLRQYLVDQPPPATSDPVSLPPSLVSFLLPHLNAASTDANTGSTSGTVATALTARNKLLQEENDELYELLKSTETGRLKEEARGLKRAVNRLEVALKDSHQVIKSLSDELDKTHDAALPVRAKTNMYASMNPPASNGSANNAKPVPTGPRAQKRQRVGEPPGMSSANSIPVGRQVSNHHGSERGTSARPIESRDPTPAIPPPDHRKVPGGRIEPIEDDRASRASRASREESRSRSSRHHERDRTSERDRVSERGRDSSERIREREPPREKNKPHERERSRGDRDRNHDREREREPRERASERARDGPREDRERDKPREDRERERDRPRADREREKARGKPAEDRERPREREREREKEREKDARGRDAKDRGDRTSRRSGGRRRHGGGGGGGGNGGGNSGRQSSLDRSLAERMGL